MVATRTASSAPDGAGSAEPSVGSGSSAPKDGRSSRDGSEEEEEETEQQASGSTGGSPDSRAHGQASASSPSGNSSNPASQPQDHLSSGQGSSSRKPSTYSFPAEQPSDVTVRVVGVPATEKHNNGKTFLQDGFGGLEALVQMESLGASELVHLYDFFEDNDVIGDYILTSRENPLSETGLTSQLESFAVKHRVKCRLAEDEDAKANVDLHDEVIRLKREQQFQTSYWIKKVAELQREKTEALSQSRSDFLLLVEEREKDVNSLRDQVRDLKAEMEVVQSTRAASGPRSRLRTAHVMNFLQDNATVVMNWALLRDLLDHLESGTQVPREWQTVITVMAYDNLVFQAPPFVRMDPPADDGDEETKERGPPGSVIDLSQDPSSKTSGSKRTRSGKQKSSPKSSKSSKKAAPDVAQDFPTDWIETRTPAVALQNLLCHVQLMMEDGLEYPDALNVVGQDKCLYTRFHLYELVLMLLSVISEGHLPEWDSLPNLHPDEAELETLELKEDEKFEVEDKDEEYDPQQDPDDGVDDEYDDEDDDSGNDSPPSIAKRTSMSGSLSTSSAEPGAPKKFKSKKSKKSQSELQSGSESESHAEVKSRSKSGSEIESTTKSKRSKRRNSGGPTELAAKGADNLTADEDRLIETPGPTVNSWMYFGVLMKSGDPTAHAPHQTPGFPDFIPNATT
ncbi:uncharacterized protein IUM83_01720 [Phytophthora cinnamomi]|uniref:uncharacterized protein n=1 Tax=Phytophthora cinnamomi TaxID=4785 RepID=UPI003559F873|nr:hypothetical protein IUM83_01720 [Phytophthora cinnamomi]